MPNRQDQNIQCIVYETLLSNDSIGASTLAFHIICTCLSAKRPSAFGNEHMPINPTCFVAHLSRQGFVNVMAETAIVLPRQPFPSTIPSKKLPCFASYGHSPRGLPTRLVISIFLSSLNISFQPIVSASVLTMASFTFVTGSFVMLVTVTANT